MTMISPAPAPAANATAAPNHPIDRILAIRPWVDPVIDQVGHDVRSPYVERFWTPALGPTTILLLRRLAADLEDAPEGFGLDLWQAALSMGLSARGGRNASFLRAIDRACAFRLARYLDHDTLEVRRKVPPLTRPQVQKLPHLARVEHRSWVESRPVTPSPADVRHRARRLALSLVDLGEDTEATERQLHRWQFHPALAHEATLWAWERRHPSIAPAPQPLDPGPTGPRVGDKGRARA